MHVNIHTLCVCVCARVNKGERREKGRFRLERKDERNNCRAETGIKNGTESDRYIKKVQERAASHPHV